jgi:hypothetical protein
MKKTLVEKINDLYDCQKSIELKKEELLKTTLQQEIYTLEHRKNVLEDDVLRAFEEYRIGQLTTDKGISFVVKEKKVPVVQDWKELYGYIIENKEFDLLHKRTSISAFRERWDAGLDIPGVQKFILKSISIKP